VIVACPSADSLETDIKPLAQAAMFYFNKISEHPDKYKIVRTTADIDAAIKQGKLAVTL